MARITMKKRGKIILRRAIKATPRHDVGAGLDSAIEAWFYENPGSIDVYIRILNGVVCARLSRRKLEQWIRRTA